MHESFIKTMRSTSATVRKNYPQLYEVYRNSATMRKSARVEDFLYLYSFTDHDFNIANINKTQLIISLCIFALRQSEDDFV